MENDQIENSTEAQGDIEIVNETQHLLDPAKFTKSDMQKLVTSNNTKLSYNSHQSSRQKNSEVWTIFEHITYDSVSLNFVKCKKCNAIYSHKPSDGSSSLLIHFKKCTGSSKSKPANTNPVNKSAKITTFMKKSVPSTAINNLNRQIVLSCAKDTRPLKCVENEGFRQLAQAFITFGSKYGDQNIDLVLQNRSTLCKKHLIDLHEEGKANLKKLFTEKMLIQGNFGVTFDMWSDKYRQAPYVSFSIHFVDNEFKLHCKNIAVRKFDLYDSDHTLAKKTTENIKTFLQQRLLEYTSVDQLNEIWDKMVAVTDGGTNVKYVFKNWYPCMCHRLNLVLEWTFGKEEEKLKNHSKWNQQKRNLETKLMENDFSANNPIANDINVLCRKSFLLNACCPKIKGSLAAVKKIVAYFKQSNLNSQLSKTLKQHVPTRWNSHLTMLESYIAVKGEVKQLLLNKNKIDLITDVDDGSIENLISLLKLFRDCTKAWSSQMKPSIHKVVRWIYLLKSNMKSSNSDEPELKLLKDQLTICMNEYLQLEDIHLAAQQLDPRYKSMKFCTTDEKLTSKQYLRSRYEKVQVFLDNSNSEADVLSQVSDEVDVPSKKSRFADLQDDPVLPSCSLSEFEKEYEKYMNLPNPEDEFDILEFWKKAVDLPVMRIVALQILSVPASQTADERVFSTTGVTISQRRSQISGSTVESLTFLNKNM